MCEGRRADAIPDKGFASLADALYKVAGRQPPRRRSWRGAQVPGACSCFLARGHGHPASARSVPQGLGAAAQPPAPSPPDLRAELRARGRCHAERSEPVRRGPRPGPGRPLAGRSRAPPGLLGCGAARALRLGRVGAPAAPVYRGPAGPLQLLSAHPLRRRRGLRARPERAQ